MAFDRLMEAAQQAGQETFEGLKQAHVTSLDREEERGQVAFESRRKAITRVGLPEVRQYRLAKCDAEETQWRQALIAAQAVLPDIRPLLLMRITKRGLP